MKIVCLKEEKNEHRVAIVPKDVKRFKELGFEVEIEESIAEFIKISDEEYINAPEYDRSRYTVFTER